jgi:hypothetical protein
MNMKLKKTTDMYFHLDISSLDESAATMVRKLLGLSYNSNIKYYIVRIVGHKKYIYGSNFNVGEKLSVNDFLEKAK